MAGIDLQGFVLRDGFVQISELAKAALPRLLRASA
jgi:hypothetical protein